MYNKDVNNIFDVGCFKDIVLGAMVVSMERAGLRKKHKIDILYHACDVLDEMKAEELEKMYHDYIRDNM